MIKTSALITMLVGLSAARLQAGEIHVASTAGDLSKVKALLEADPKLLESKDIWGRDASHQHHERDGQQDDQGCSAPLPIPPQ
jgi:hypothetical protein